MKNCPFCAKPIEDLAQFCTFCGMNVSATVPPPAAGAAGPPFPAGGQTSGKAIASLVCGITAYVILPLLAAIPAIVLGHIAVSDIQKAAGRLKGHGLAVTGMVLGYAQIALLPMILIIAAIAIPNLLRARMAANEASAVGSLRVLNTASVTYATQFNSFPASLPNLGPGAEPGAANLIDAQLAGGQKSGYVFTFIAGPSEDGVVKTYSIHADPLTEGTTGMRHFFTDQTGVIRFNSSGPADDASPPIS